MARFGLQSLMEYFVLIITVISTITTAVFFNEQNIIAKQNDDVTITCSVIGFHPSDVIQILKIGGIYPVLVSENQFLQAEFSRTGRWYANLNHNQETGEASVVIKITGAEGPDRGQYECYRLSRIEDRSIVDLQVQVPISSLEVRIIPELGEGYPVTSGTTIPLKEGHRQGFSCSGRIRGISHGPEMHVYLGSENEDITSMFQAMNTSTHEDEIFGAQNSEIQLVYRTDKPDRKMNGKNVRCVAKSEGYPDESIEARLQVEYSPELRCHERQHWADQEEALFVSCDLWANPSAAITWYYEDDDDRGELVQMEDHPDYKTSFRAATELIEGDHSKVKLHFYKFTESHQFKYTVEATNTHGKSMSAFRIFRDSMAVDEETADVETEANEAETHDIEGGTSSIKSSGVLDPSSTTSLSASHVCIIVQLLTLASLYYMAFVGS